LHLGNPAGSPGQPPGGEVVAIAPDVGRFRKGNHPQGALKKDFVVLLQHRAVCLHNGRNAGAASPVLPEQFVVFCINMKSVL
jgi:hypothetical protein